MFNLTLNVSSSLNGSQYQCEVTIDHDGSNIRDYDGVLITIVTITGLGMIIILLWTMFSWTCLVMEVVCLSSAHAIQTAIIFKNLAF